MGKQQGQAEWGSWNDKQNGEAGITSRMGKQQGQAEWGSKGEKVYETSVNILNNSNRRDIQSPSVERPQQMN